MALLCHHTAQVGHYERTHSTIDLSPKDGESCGDKGS